MALYPFDGENLPEGRILRTGLDAYRDGVQKLNRIKGILAQASDQNLVDLFGFASTTVAASAKAELLSDIPAFTPATQQMLDQFG
jgi:hypothetical protein